MLQSETYVREHAYTLWVQDGCPTGEADHYWFRAQHELAALVPTATAKSTTRAKAAKPAAAKTVKTKAATTKTAADKPAKAAARAKAA